MATPAEKLEKTAPAPKLDDYKAIESVVAKYIEGGRRGDAALMRPIFHEGAVMYGHTGDGLTPGPIQALFDYTNAGEPARDLDHRITSINISDGVAASVVLNADNWHGVNYTDHFHMLKVDGEWKIFSKIFSHN